MARAHGRGRQQGGVLSLTLRPVILTVKSFLIGVNVARVIGADCGKRPCAAGHAQRSSRAAARFARLRLLTLLR
jgi:hypothetical protein